MRAFVEVVDCSRFSPDRGSTACDEQADTAVGVLLVLAVLVLAAGWLLWRRVRRRYETGPTDGIDRTADEVEERREELREEYRAGLEAGDAGTRETSRDYYDDAGTPWRLEVGLGLGIVVLFGSLLVLIPLFLVLRSLTS